MLQGLLFFHACCHHGNHFHPLHLHRKTVCPKSPRTCHSQSRGSWPCSRHAHRGRICPFSHSCHGLRYPPRYDNIRIHKEHLKGGQRTNVFDFCQITHQLCQRNSVLQYHECIWFRALHGQVIHQGIRKNVQQWIQQSIQKGECIISRLQRF